MARCVLILAALYNLAFGVWLGLWPQAVFSLFDMPQSWPSWLSRVLAVGIAGFGLLYVHAARRADHRFFIVALGLLAKVLPPLAWVAAVSLGAWPLRTWSLILCNDVIWWIPFGLLLRRLAAGRS